MVINKINKHLLGNYLMDKKGQFYLLTTIILVGLIFSFATVINYSQEKNVLNFNYLKDELNIVSGNVIDYALYNNKDVNESLINFSKVYSNYSEADNMYYIFGNRDSITVAGYQKKNDGSIMVDVGSGNQELIFSKGVYKSQSFSNPENNIKISVDSVVSDFSLSSGENFYFILSKEVRGDVYVVRSYDYNYTVGSGSSGTGAVCGNGIIETGEQCDDSNLVDGDGCSSSCQTETGFSCTGEPSSCTFFGGDGG
jgi:cysteine-rich repeat protein